MRSLLILSFKSLMSRKLSTFLTVLSIALSVTLLLGIERIRTGTKHSFESTVSGVDLIVGARSGQINLLLYSVFRIGNATNNVPFSVFQEFSNHPAVEWQIPISLGDSHKGFPVIGTTPDYFKYYRYSGGRALDFAQGGEFSRLFDVVLGSEVARLLKYDMKTALTLSHGTGAVSFQDHDSKKFRVVGILKPTGTPVDRSLHISLKAMTALHLDWENGAPPLPGEELSNDQINEEALDPADITAFLVRLKTRIAVFNMQREINDYSKYPMMAILPGVALRDFWQNISTIERVLFVVSGLVLVVSVLGMLIALLSSLNEKRREMAILRSVGAHKSFVFMMLVSEALILTGLGIIMGLTLLYVLLFASQILLKQKLGLSVGLFTPSWVEIIYLSLIIGLSLVASLIPAAMNYRRSLVDGLVVKS